MAYNPFYNIENTELMGYEYAWVNYIKGRPVPENIIAPEIFDSWRRCKERDLCATAFIIPEKITEKSIITTTEADRPLLETSSHIMNAIVNTFKVKDVHMFIVDWDYNTLLDAVSGGTKVAEPKSAISQVFSDVRETVIGTNSLELAIRLQKPISVLGAQHYYQRLHGYADYAAPIFGEKGQLRGAIGIVVKVEEMNRYMLAMVVAAASALENNLLLAESNEIINKQNKEKQRILDSVTDGVVYVDEHNLITQVNSRMVNLMGYTEKSIIGQKIKIIETIPPLKKIENVLTGGERDNKIKLRGRERSYNCFVNKFAINEDSGEDKNAIWIFTALEDIQLLADKINTDNLAYFTFEDIQGRSPKLQEAIELGKKAAAYETRVILQGESGTGKEMFAQAIHNAGPRKKEPFIAVDCGAIPRELLESEIFGYEEGAYTGARKGGNRGKFELAHKGTLFLDEIGNMPLEMQAKLLRVLQENKVVRLGGSTAVATNVQVIAATNMDLEKEVQKGTFREDLFYRLNIIQIKLPSLRERPEDIPILVNEYIGKHNASNGRKIRVIEDAAMKILQAYDWPGNVRQLNNVIERMSILSDKGTLTSKDVPTELILQVEKEINPKDEFDRLESLEAFSVFYVQKVVDNCNGNIKKAAQILKISRPTVYNYLKKAGVTTDDIHD